MKFCSDSLVAGALKLKFLLPIGEAYRLATEPVT